MTPEDIASRCQKMKKHGRGYDACCPAHDDHTPSLSINPGTNGGVVLHCHAGCEPTAIVNALGLTLADLMPEEKTHTNGNGNSNGTGKPEIAATYDYTDSDGVLVFQVVRKLPKGFSQRRPDGRGGWIYSIPDSTPKLLYQLPMVQAAIQTGDTVYIVEGEKDAQTLALWGLVATTNAGGAGKWRQEHTLALTNAHVVILSDNDDAGKKHAEQVRQSVATVAATVTLAPVFPGAKDVTDWVLAGGTKARFLAHVTPEPPFYYLRELFQRPDLLEPPPVVVPRLAWEGRVTLLAAREKVGKSTLMGQAVAALATAPTEFLSANLPGPMKTLWVGIDEPLGDIVRRLDRYELNAHPLDGRVAIRNRRPSVTELMDWIRAEQFRLVILDHLTSYAMGRVEDTNKAMQYQPIMQELSLIARETKAALVVLHHAAKGGGYRDSTAIGAAVDAIIIMRTEKDEDGEEKDNLRRKFECKGRVPMQPSFETDYINGYHQLTNVTLPLDQQILKFVARNPGCSGRDIRDGVGAKDTRVIEMMNRLAGEGKLRNMGTDQRAKWNTVA